MRIRLSTPALSKQDMGSGDIKGHLVNYEIDLAVGGFTDTNAWVDKVGLTRPYTGTHVVMVPMGENAWMSRLERWLDEHGDAR